MLAWIFKHLAQFHHYAFLQRLSARLLRAHQLLENRNYDIETNGEARVARIVLAPPFDASVVFDVGANVGEWSGLIHRLSARVQLHAFEPVARTFEQLQQAYAGLPGVVLNRCGLAERDAERTIYHAPAHSALATCVPGTVEAIHHIQPGAESIRVQTGDAYCERAAVKKIDLLKIDVEGMEHQVLCGFTRMLETRAIRAIQFEYGYVSVRTRFLLGDFYELLGRYGFMLGKIYPSYVDFRAYRPAHEDFLGPNFLAVLDTETALIDALGRA